MRADGLVSDISGGSAIWGLVAGCAYALALALFSLLLSLVTGEWGEVAVAGGVATLVYGLPIGSFVGAVAGYLGGLVYGLTAKLVVAGAKNVETDAVVKECTVMTAVISLIIPVAISVLTKLAGGDWGAILMIYGAPAAIASVVYTLMTRRAVRNQLAAD